MRLFQRVRFSGGPRDGQEADYVSREELTLKFIHCGENEVFYWTVYSRPDDSVTKMKFVGYEAVDDEKFCERMREMLHKYRESSNN